MPSDMFNQVQGARPKNFIDALNELKSRGGDPNQMIQEMLNNGKQMLPTSVRR